MSPPAAPCCRGSGRREEGQRTPPPAGNAPPGQAGKAPDNRLIMVLHVSLMILSALAVVLLLQTV